SRRRSADGDVGASVTAGATRGERGLLEVRIRAAVKMRSGTRWEKWLIVGSIVRSYRNASTRPIAEGLVRRNIGIRLWDLSACGDTCRRRSSSIIKKPWFRSEK